MECSLLNSVGQSHIPSFKVENICGRGNMASYNSSIGFHTRKLCVFPTRRYSIPCTSWRISCIPGNLEEEFSAVLTGKIAEVGESDPEEVPEQPLSSDELKSLLLDAERSKLLKKLSDANQYNRLLKREALVRLADEIAKSAIPAGSRKINGKYIQSHLFLRLDAIQEKLNEQIKDVEAAQAKEVPLSWIGVAESVQVMGSFDGWSKGEHLSPEYTGSYMHFSTALFLRPGRYEIKFLVDGEWQLSPDIPTTGEGFTLNNLLIVE